MDDTLPIFEDAMSEEGVDADIMTYEDHTGMSTVFEARTTVGGEQVTERQAISHRERDRVDDMQQYIAQIASRMARGLSAKMQDRVEWGENAVEFDSTSSYKVTCLRCGESVSTDDLDGHTQSVGIAESTVPHPPTPDFESLPQHKLRMVLLAALRSECLGWCPNSDAETFI